jgi:hypothetical protein
VAGLSTGWAPRAALAPMGNVRGLLTGDESRRGLVDEMALMIHHRIFPGNPRSLLCREGSCPIFPCWYRRGSNDENDDG